MAHPAARVPRPQRKGLLPGVGFAAVPGATDNPKAGPRAGELEGGASAEGCTLPFPLVPWDTTQALPNCKADFLVCLAGTQASFWKRVRIFHWPVFICFMKPQHCKIIVICPPFFFWKKILIRLWRGIWQQPVLYSRLSGYCFSWLERLLLAFFLESRFLLLPTSMCS